MYVLDRRPSLALWTDWPSHDEAGEILVWSTWRSLLMNKTGGDRSKVLSGASNAIESTIPLVLTNGSSKQNRPQVDLKERDLGRV
jgi:hypothetical protein